MKLLNLVISRKKWGRGAEGGQLLTSEGLMCCLGFAAKADGYKATTIFDKGMPADIFDDSKRKVKPGGYLSRLLTEKKTDTPLCKSLARVNDNALTSDKVKETAIKNRFAKIGIKVTFTA